VRHRPIWRSFSTRAENSFRKEIYPAYKANRSEPPEDPRAGQFPLFREAARAFGLQPVEQDVYEATT